MHPAKHSRLEKEAHPERFCATKLCLWRLTSGPCPKHPVKESESVMLQDRKADWQGGYPF